MNWSDLIVHAEPWQGAVLGAGCLILTALLYGWGSDRPKPTWLLALLRLASLGVLALLLLEPMVRRNTETVERPLLPVLVDQTSSQWTGADSLDRREALATLVGALPTWAEAAEWEMALLGFDRDVVELSPEGWQADGKRTDFGGALETVRNRFVHRNVPAVVVVTDGRVNRGPDPEYSARKLDVPHVFVGTGDTAVVKDLDLTDLRMNEVAYLGNAFPVEVTVRSRGFQDVPLSVQLTSNGQILDSKPWTPSQNLASTTWTTQLDADKAGVRTVTARIQVQGGTSASEATTANNSRTASIEVLESRRKILFVAQAPHPDLAALRAAAETNQHQETDVVWLSDDLAADLPEHDVLVLHHIDPLEWPRNWADDVQRSPALWVLGHANSTWRDWGMGRFGFSFDTQDLITEAQGHVTKAFDAFPMPEALTSMVDVWPPLACPTGTYTVSPTLTAALTQQVGPVTTEWPLWAVRKEDNTRTAVTLGEGLWRWRIQDVAQHNGESVAFDALVNGTLQYLSSRTDVNRLRIQAPERLDEDVRCTFVAEVYDASLTPTKDVDVLLSLTQRGGLATEHNFAANARGTDLTADLGNLLPGVYDWEARCTQGGESLKETGTLVVQEVQAEASLSPADHRMLRRMATATSGTFLGTLDTPEDAPELKRAWDAFSATLSAQDVVHMSSERQPLHAEIWLLVVLLALLTTEWAIRRSAGAR